MDNLSGGADNNKGFGIINHVLDFGDDSKDEMANIVQYAVLAIIPVVILNKITQKIIPEANEEKGNVEILAEVIGQIVSMFIGILIIHRIITYIPTYSGKKYSDFFVTSNILAVLVIILSLQTKLGEKISILVDRVVELWEGPSDTKPQHAKKVSGVKVSQPISQNKPVMQQSTSYSNSTPIHQLPVVPQMQSQPVQQQSSQDYINNYRQENTFGTSNSYSLGNQSGMMMDNEPMAANFGGSSFGSNF
jgi:hypothetical protein